MEGKTWTPTVHGIFNGCPRLSARAIREIRAKAEVDDTVDVYVGSHADQYAGKPDAIGGKVERFGKYDG
jgi:hypothetical protein